MQRTLVLLAGVVLVALGGYTLASGFTYAKKERVLEIGGITADMERRETVPPWLGGLGVVVGLGLILGAARRSS